VLPAGSATVIVDYAHNPSALAALVEALDQLPHTRRTLVFTACNRRDADVVKMGEVIGNGFDRLVLYQDRGNNDRADGELHGLLLHGLAAGRRAAQIEEAAGELPAIEAALESLAPGELLVVGVESIDEGLALVQRRLAAGGPSGRPPQASPETLSV
jgi:cyanophycin synthetase